MSREMVDDASVAQGVCRFCGRTDGMDEWEWEDVADKELEYLVLRGVLGTFDDPSGFYRQTDDPSSLYVLCDECNYAGLVPVDYRELTWGQVSDWLRETAQ